jgi:hypothetical protein
VTCPLVTYADHRRHTPSLQGSVTMPFILDRDNDLRLVPLMPCSDRWSRDAQTEVSQAALVWAGQVLLCSCPSWLATHSPKHLHRCGGKDAGVVATDRPGSSGLLMLHSAHLGQPMTRQAAWTGQQGQRHTYSSSRSSTSTGHSRSKKQTVTLLPTWIDVCGLRANPNM